MTSHTTRTAHGFGYEVASAWILTAVYAVAGLAAMWFAPRVPYADGWRFLARFLQAPFPRDVLAPDNGHHEVLPNAVRVLELHAFAAQQWLQVLVGIALMLATLMVLWRIVRQQAEPEARAAAMLAAVLGLLWLGNVRALAHGNESVHAYFVTLFLVLGLHVLLRPEARMHSARYAAVAATCGLAAAFSFGSGIACFAAFFAVLGLQRAPWRAWAVLVAGVVVTLVLLHWIGGSSASPGLAPLQQIGILTRWLAGPSVYVFWPAFDPALAARLPLDVLRTPMQAVAVGYEGAFGPVMLATWPHALVGAVGVAWLAVASWRTYRLPTLPVLAGVGMAWFAVAVGAMLALVRLPYFDMHPDQLLAPRYIVWSSLFWAGLGIAGIAQAKRPRRALAATVLVALVLLPSQAWMAKLGLGMRDVAAQVALAGAVGVLEPELPLGETTHRDLTAALPLLRAADAAVFAWAETGWIGRSPPAEITTLLDARDVRVVDVDNRLGAPGRRVQFELDDAPVERLLLLDEHGVVRGLAMRDPQGAARWTGWMQGSGAGRMPPRVAALTR